jgi:hypothetical protein
LYRKVTLFLFRSFVSLHNPPKLLHNKITSSTTRATTDTVYYLNISFGVTLLKYLNNELFFQHKWVYAQNQSPNNIDAHDLMLMIIIYRLHYRKVVLI